LLTLQGLHTVTAGILFIFSKNYSARNKRSLSSRHEIIRQCVYWKKCLGHCTKIHSGTDVDEDSNTEATKQQTEVEQA